MMNKIAIYIIIIILIFGVTGAQGKKNEKTLDETRIVIKPVSPIAKDAIMNTAKSNGGIFVREMHDGSLIFNIQTAALGKLKSNSNILENAKHVEEDVLIELPPQDFLEISSKGINEGIQLTPNDPLYPQQWNMPMISSNIMWDYLTGENIIVAVIDTGVDYNHEDLAGVDESLGWDFVNNDPDPWDDHGHGTHVAGIVAATMNNNKGVVGVAPGATVMPVKVCNQYGSCWATDIADGIVWAADHGAKILSLSLGGSSPDIWTYYATAYAVYNKGTLVIAASGNNGLEQPSYPGAYPWALAIGALDYDGERASYSQYGNFLDLMAPGGSLDGNPSHMILSTYPSNSYAYMSGTSMATPHASGVVALYWSHNPSYSNRQVGTALLISADDLGTPGWDKLNGFGLVDAYPPID